jgi:hypothetical protein
MSNKQLYKALKSAKNKSNFLAIFGNSQHYIYLLRVEDYLLLLDECNGLDPEVFSDNFLNLKNI